MVLGQATDLEGQLRALSLSELEVMHQRKTGALIEASLAMVARVVGDVGVERSLERFARHIGLAFQIVDDILDITGDQDKLGKDVGSDLIKDKTTYPALYGLEESKRKAEELIEQSIDCLEEFDCRADPLREIARYFVQRTY